MQGGRRKACGHTWGFVFCFVLYVGGAEHVLISHNATHYVASHYALCQHFTSVPIFSDIFLLLWPQPVHPESRVNGGGVSCS